MRAVIWRASSSALRLGAERIGALTWARKRPWGSRAAQPKMMGAPLMRARRAGPAGNTVSWPRNSTLTPSPPLPPPAPPPPSQRHAGPGPRQQPPPHLRATGRQPVHHDLRLQPLRDGADLEALQQDQRAGDLDAADVGAGEDDPLAVRHRLFEVLVG